MDDLWWRDAVAAEVRAVREEYAEEEAEAAEMEAGRLGRVVMRLR